MPARSEALAAKRRNIVQAHIEAEASTHDVAAALRTFHHPRYEVPALAAIADGSEAVTGLLNALLAAFPDFFLRQHAVHEAENAVIVECTFGGTQQGVWAGLPPSGKRMEVQAALIFLFEGENLICEKVYFDHATILAQLSAKSS
jgi:steroid delta-isomerase-like uncharacterized protein